MDRQFAWTNSREESIVGIDSDHRDLCNGSDSPLVLKFIRSALVNARLRISSKPNDPGEYNFAPSQGVATCVSFLSFPLTLDRVVSRTRRAQ